MSAPLVLALDAMGGDSAPKMVIKGVKIARRRFPYVHFLLFGDEASLAPLLNKKLRRVCTIRHAPDVVAGDAKPSAALRQGRKASMWLALQAVKDGEAAGVVSAGNTGALMAMAKLSLRMLPGIDRPAIATLLPTSTGESVVLDLGANPECTASHLVQFAIMGEVFSQTLLGIARPTVGLLNIGSEELKGTDALRQASSILRDHAAGSVNYHGFVEGDDIGKGTVDVVVTDGFTGNVALKTAEGTANLYSKFLKNAFSSSLIARVGYVLAKRALDRVRRQTDPRRYNGAMFIGLNGVCVKSHGGTDARGFSNALGVAVNLVSNDVNTKIKGKCADLTTRVSMSLGDVPAVRRSSADRPLSSAESGSGQNQQTVAVGGPLTSGKAASGSGGV